MTDHETEPLLLDAYEWARRAGITIFDPDGWRGGVLDGYEARLLEDPITQAEFEARIAVSAVDQLVDRDEEPIAMTAPMLPWEIHLNTIGLFFQRLSGRGMELKFAPVMRAQMGAVPISPGVVVRFDEAEWEQFQEAIATNGESMKRKPDIQVARTMPGAPR